MKVIYKKKTDLMFIFKNIFQEETDLYIHKHNKKQHIMYNLIFMF